MSKKLLLAVAFALALTMGAFAQAFTVSYLDGMAELQSAKGWKVLAIGDQVPADGSVRVSQDGSLELQRGQTRISILKDGTYDVASLVKSSDKNVASGVGNTISKKLQSLVTEKPKTGTVGGVRGAAQGTSDGSVMWVDENDDTRSQVQSLLDKKQFTEALKVLNQAIAEATPDTDVSELSYLSGVAYYGAGQTARAYRTLVKLDPTPDTAWYARFVILKAQVFVDTQNYKDALSVLTPFISSFPTGEATQVAYLLTYYSQKGLGDQTAAKSALDAGFKLDPATDTAKLIDQQRKAP